MRQYPLQALRRPYRRVPCRWRRDAAPGRTRHCPSLHLASQREDAPAPMDRTARLRQETPRGSPPPACQRERRRNGGPGFGREPLRKKVNTQALKLDRQKWLLQGEGAFNLYRLECPDRTCTCAWLFGLFCTLFAVGSHRVGNYISKQYTIAPPVFLTMKKPVLQATRTGSSPAKIRIGCKFHLRLPLARGS